MYNEKETNFTNINWYPGHMEKARRLIAKEYQNIDVVYELVDARIPKSSKIPNIYDMIGNKPKVLIMTKVDLADPNVTDKWIRYYENLGNKVCAIDLKNDNDIKDLLITTESLVNEMQEKRIEKGLQKKTINVVVIGIPNVGKSTLINKLAGRKVANVGNKPGITKGITWLKTKYNMQVLDTPGILWPKLEQSEVALNLAALFSIKTEILDVNEIAVHILNKLNKYYPEKLKERYNIDKYAIEIDIEECYSKIGSHIGAIKNGEVDYERVSSRIINDLKDEYIKGISFDHEI